MYFRYFVIIFPWKRAGPIWRHLNPLHPRMLCAKFGRKWLSGSGEEVFFKFRQCIFAIFYYLSLKMSGILILNKLESPSPKDALCQVWLKLAQWFWRRRWLSEKITDWQTDGHTDDGRQVIRKAHLSFQLRWAKNFKTITVLRFDVTYNYFKIKSMPITTLNVISFHRI